MKRLKAAGRILTDLVEVWIPETVFVALFFAFLINVFFRYVMKNPQNWTFELSINAFVIVGLLGACAAYRKEDHVVFDLMYTRAGSRGKSIMRMIGYGTVIIFFLIALPGTIRYLWRLRSVTSIMKLPLRLIFASFPILLLSTILRSAYRLVLDIRSFRAKTYDQTYNLEESETLI
jgi:TRAP-type C4-dicarboxylate transport system permease small subunit